MSLVNHPPRTVGVWNNTLSYWKEVGEFWAERDWNLAAGFQEAVNAGVSHYVEGKKALCNKVQVAAGIGIGAFRVLGSLPLGLAQWGIDTVRETALHGLGAGVRTLVTTPLVGLAQGGLAVFQEVKGWVNGSLLNQSAFQIADRVTTTLASGALIALGFKGLGRGVRNVGVTLKKVSLPSASLRGGSGILSRVGVRVPIFTGVPTLTAAVVGGGAIGLGAQISLMAMKGRGASLPPGGSSLLPPRSDLPDIDAHLAVWDRVPKTRAEVLTALEKYIQERISHVKIYEGNTLWSEATSTLPKEYQLKVGVKPVEQYCVEQHIKRKLGIDLDSFTRNSNVTVKDVVNYICEKLKIKDAP